MTDEQKLQRIVSNPYLFIRSFMRVVDKNGAVVPFIPNNEQKELLKGMDRFNIILKSRQLGITTLSCAYSIYLAITKPNITCLLMAHSNSGGDVIFDKLKQLYFNLPDYIKLDTIANNKKEIKLVNGSSIIVMTCGRKESVRGSTLAFVHISEAGSCSDTLKKQILAIEQCLTPDSKMIIESTANGFNYFQELWSKSERGENLYKPFFFGWVDGKEQFADEYKQYAARYISLHGALPCAEEMSEAEYNLYMNLGATLEQIAWRRLKISNSSEVEFMQEFPATPLEAFIVTGDNVFDSLKLQERLSNLALSKTIDRPNSLSDTLKRWFNSTLLIWEAPRPGIKYYCGVDTAEGYGGDHDYSVIEVFDEDGYQAAEYRSNAIKPYDFVAIVYDLARFYNKAMLVVEKQSAGQIVLSRLHDDYHYSNMYKHKKYDARGKSSRKIGFETNKQNKPEIISTFQELFETDSICINSKFLLEEMKSFIYKDGSTEASVGNHDDCVMATALALLGKKYKTHFI